ncbi:hypothetical protein MNBD_NITROSPINAE05-841 [hydrothermal vent metagenome]|uniref:Uncharacterized protein n=1 Tax=hydrothermal vent metagenome TaxID=652676 RepID=A0A3B1CXR8_9ZZZZ
MSDHHCGFICKNSECERKNKIDDTFQFPAELDNAYPCSHCGWVNELESDVRFNRSSRVLMLLKINSARPPA